MPETTSSATRPTHGTTESLDTAALLDAGLADLQAEARAAAMRRPRLPGHLLAQGVHPPHHAVPGPLRLLHVRQGSRPAASPPTCPSTRWWPSPAPGATPGCHEALFTLGEGPEDRYPAARAPGSPSTATPRPSTTWWRCARLVLEETGLLPHANAGALDAERARAAPSGLGQPGDDARVPQPRPGRPPVGARQDARAPAGHPGGGRRGSPSPSPPGSWSGSARAGATGSRPSRPSPPATPATATCRR